MPKPRRQKPVAILHERERIKRQTIQQRRLQHETAAA
jgi:hypothetical protein